MSNYLGYKCIVCGQKFNENDDIVVCPDCGTPYHRECFVKSGRCVNEELHDKGESWNGNGSEKSEYKKCPYCQNVNKPHTLICEQCGAPLAENFGQNRQADAPENGSAGMNGGMYGQAFAFNPQDKCCGMNPEEEFESVKLKDLADFVRTNQIYYLPIFKKIKDTGQKISVNIVSFLFPQLYFANRKMWLWTALSIIVSVVLSIPSMLYLLSESDIAVSVLNIVNVESKSFSIIYNASGFMNFAFKALMLMFSNWFYYRYAVKKIKSIKMSDETADSGKISSAGGTSVAAVFISIAVQTVVTMTVIMLFTR